MLICCCALCFLSMYLLIRNSIFLVLVCISIFLFQFLKTSYFFSGLLIFLIFHFFFSFFFTLFSKIFQQDARSQCFLMLSYSFHYVMSMNYFVKQLLFSFLSCSCIKCCVNIYPFFIAKCTNKRIFTLPVFL